MQQYTTDEAAALLSERGLTDRTGGPVKVDTVKHWRAQGKFPHSVLVKRGPGRGYWLIPREDLDAFQPPGGSKPTP